MPQITGKAVIRVDGEEWRTEDGAKLNPGGVTREAKVGGGKVHGFAEKTKLIGKGKLCLIAISGSQKGD